MAFISCLLLLRQVPISKAHRVQPLRLHSGRSYLIISVSVSKQWKQTKIKVHEWYLYTTLCWFCCHRCWCSSYCLAIVLRFFFFLTWLLEQLFIELMPLDALASTWAPSSSLRWESSAKRLCCCCICLSSVVNFWIWASKRKLSAILLCRQWPKLNWLELWRSVST